MEQHRTRAAAEDRALELRQAVPMVAAGGETLGAYIERWLGQVGPTLRVGTHRVYAAYLRKHVTPVLGPLTIGAVTASHVRDLVGMKLREGLAKKTVLNIARTLHACLATAVEDGLIVRNPAASSKGRKTLLRRSRAEKREKVKAFTPEQLRLLLDTCAAKAPRYWLIFRLMSLTGMRPGEAMALKWSSIDWAGRKIVIQRGWTGGRLEPTKNGEERAVDLAAELADELRAYDVTTKASALASGRARLEWLFPSQARDAPLDESQLQRAIKRVLAAAGLPGHFTAHCLRHTYATTLLTRHAPIYYVSKQLGHASIQITVDTYGSWLPSGDPAIADRLAGFYAGISHVGDNVVTK
ncbi:MAG: site-specific integrase [Vicinamibacteria bacterium]|nr:site-specific integrase [Vicinamibacteria bacterium]